MLQTWWPYFDTSRLGGDIEFCYKGITKQFTFIGFAFSTLSFSSDSLCARRLYLEKNIIDFLMEYKKIIKKDKLIPHMLKLSIQNYII